MTSATLVLPCSGCSPTSAMSVDGSRAVIRCQTCGTERELVRRPMYLVTGAPGVGKTSVVNHLVGRIDGLPVFDTDLFGDFSHPQWAAWANSWLLVVHGLATNCLSTVLCGYGLHRREIDELAARELIGEIRALNLDLPDEELRARLRPRPGYDEDRIERKVARARAFRVESDANVDVAGLSPAEVAIKVEDWLRQQISGEDA